MVILKINKFDGTPISKIYDAIVDSFSIRFGGGQALVRIPRSSKSITEYNIVKKNQAEIMLYNKKSKKFETVYSGYISSIDELNFGGQFLAITIAPLHDVFRGRIVDGDFTGQAGNVASSVFNNITSESPVGFDVGEILSNTTIDLSVDNASAYSFFDDLAATSSCEWDVSPKKKFYFKESVGEENQAFLRFDYKRLNWSNILELSFVSNEKDFANRIVAFSKNDAGDTIEYTAEDAESIAKSGLVVQRVSIDTAKDLQSLQNAAEKILQEKKSVDADIIVKVKPPSERQSKVSGDAIIADYTYTNYIAVGDGSAIAIDDEGTLLAYEEGGPIEYLQDGDGNVIEETDGGAAIVTRDERIPEDGVAVLSSGEEIILTEKYNRNATYFDGVGFFDINLGDDVLVYIKEYNIFINERRRVTEIRMEQQNNTYLLTLVLSALQKTQNALYSRSRKKQVETLEERVQKIENKL